MFAYPPRWTCTFNQPLAVWKSIPGYPDERHGRLEVFFTRQTVEMVPAAPSCDARETLAVRSEHRGIVDEVPLVASCVVLVTCREEPTPNALASAYAPPPAPASTAATSTTIPSLRPSRGVSRSDISTPSFSMVSPCGSPAADF